MPPFFVVCEKKGAALAAAPGNAGVMRFPYRYPVVQSGISECWQLW